MSKQIIGLHLLGWLAAGLVLVVSLFSAAKLGSDRDLTASGLTWYWHKPILPDHLAYPALMLVDRLALESTKGTSARVHMQVNYSHRRLQAAIDLVEKQKPGLALTALTKAQKYLNQAAIEALSPDATLADKRLVIVAIENQDDEIKKLEPHFTQFDQEVMGHLHRDAEMLEEKLIDSF